MNSPFIRETGRYFNPQKGRYEGWTVNQRTGEQRLVWWIDAEMFNDFTPARQMEAEVTMWKKALGLP